MPIVKRYTFQVNQKAMSSQVNANFDDIISAYNVHNHTNIGTDAGLITSSGIAPGAISNTGLSTSAITLGYAQRTSSFTTGGTTTEQQVTGLTSAVTIPSGGRFIKITAFVASVFTNPGTAYLRLSIWDGAVISGTCLAYAEDATTVANSNSPIGPVIVVVQPAAGSKTYNVGFLTNNAAAPGNIAASSISPAFILVEAI